ncbi:uricase-2 isozyme 1 [Mercurialis annua]|uniref:uricase-2 isozyme 1 n=1 Tax=Mercurialis annua TaxID=3986 RepID=UPI00215EBC06|nr:uricase-2 isozyme 1 [Mercurialis annua]
MSTSDLIGFKFEHKHGKDRVRVTRVWRKKDGTHFMVEWSVNITLFSDCLPAYTNDDNSSIVATDTMKNMVYVKAQQCSEQLSAENFAIILAQHFTSFYREVNAATINIVEKPWERVTVDGQLHSHGFKFGAEKHTTEVTLTKFGALQLSSGVLGLSILKTTQAGFEGFIRDKYTVLPETQERILATEVTASWRYAYNSVSSIPQNPLYFTERYLNVKEVLNNTFFGPPKEGVYSPSVQSTLFHMANAVINRFPDILSIKLQMPNLHFLPVNISNEHCDIVKFNDDVYQPTDEPHGSIEATLSRFISKM